MSAFITKCVYAFTFLALGTCYNFSLEVFDSKNLDKNGKPVLLQTSGNTIARSGDIFEKFVRDMLDLLSNNFRGKKLVRFCKYLGQAFKRFQFRYTKKLAKHFRHLSKMDKDELREEIRSYREELEKKPPRLMEFLAAMNGVFTTEQGVRFNDYVLDVRDYGTDDKLDVKEETRSLLDTIIKAVEELSLKEQKQLKRKLKKALQEYEKDEPNVYSMLFNITKPQRASQESDDY